MKIFKTARAYADMVKLAHTLFALPFALSAVVLARESGFDFGFWKLTWIILAFATARAAAMGFNRVADAKIDAENPRTKNRPIQSGKISLREAKLFTLLSAILFCSIAFAINPLCGVLSFPALCVLFGYSYAKRFTASAHYILGLALALAPVGAWIAVSNTFDPRICALALGLLFHISSFDLFYALQDQEFDKANSLHSIPSKLGTRATYAFAGFGFALASALFVLTGVLFDLGVIYYACVALVALAYASSWVAMRKVGESALQAVFLYANIGAGFAILLGISSKLF